MLIAITGGIGCGKSVVSGFLRVKGYPVYDCDANAKKLMTEDNRLRKELIAIFGPNTYYDNGSLNKSLLSQAIFSSPELLKKMNAAVHPAVARDIYHSIELSKSTFTDKTHKESLFFYESAILFESHFNEIAIPDKVISVSAPLELRIMRIMARDKSTREDIEKRISNQMPQEEKDKLADYIIKNDDKSFVIAQLNHIIPNFFCQSR